MKPVFALRLSLDLTAAGLLLFGLSYWWLGDVAHEIAGTLLLLLVLLHNGFNRRWYGKAAHARLNLDRLFDLGVTLMLVIAMLLLLVTSTMITNSLPDWLPAGAAFTVRQAHVLAAYWAFVIVAVHLGLRWPVIMAAVRRLLGIARANRWRTLALRLAALCIAVQGMRSFAALGLTSRLTMQMSLDWWNFDDAVLGFFLHCVAVAGLLIAASYYMSRQLRRVGPASASAIPQRLNQERQGR